MYSGDDGARTRDLCRDSTEAGSNLLKLSVTDGFFWRSEIPSVTVIGPLSDPRPLPCKPLPKPSPWVYAQVRPATRIGRLKKAAELPDLF